jgi:catechol 2,3-dioxygenase-like lactoylglutathione lyase family enzyme
VADLGQSRRFYERALEPLGYSVAMETEDFVGFRGEDSSMFAIRSGKVASTSAHVAFQAGDRATVDGFHSAAVGAGGTDQGAPGVREHYHPNYYAAFVDDPDGNNIEAVCHSPA